MSGAPSGRRLCWVLDIPSPYRVHLFNALEQAARPRGIDLSVLFMAQTVSYRKWQIDPREMRFANRVVPGVHFSVRSNVFHFNPGIVWDVLRGPWDWLAVGGTWWMPTSVAAMAAARRHRACKVVMHLEANRHSMRHATGVVSAARRTILARADAFVVPGQIAVDTLTEVCDGAPKPFVTLPNVVDEARFGAEVHSLRARRSELRARHDLGPDDLVMLWPARLEEDLKGILRFLGAVKDLVPPRVRLLLAGEGVDRPRIERWVTDNLPRNVRLLGHQPQAAMLELLAAADLLLLPSLIDPNPLSVVEGLWAGLPLFISSRCGNSPEALDGRRNGWGVEPEDVESVRAAFAELAACSPADLEQRGAISRQLAEQRFSTPACVAAFVDALERL